MYSKKKKLMYRIQQLKRISSWISARCNIIFFCYFIFLSLPNRSYFLFFYSWYSFSSLCYSDRNVDFDPIGIEFSTATESNQFFALSSSNNEKKLEILGFLLLILYIYIFFVADKAPSEATFYGKEYVEYNLIVENEAASTTQETINFSFRTKYANGFLFHSGKFF